MLFPDLDESAVFVSRSDPKEILGSYSNHPFKLDDDEWPSVEHYFQAMKYDGVNEAHKEKIRLASDPQQAVKLGRTRFKKLRPDWKKVRRVMMTRAIYTKCRAYPEIGQALVNTDERKIIENSMYDYFWGCGRDRRGENTYGQVLMDVRRKLREFFQVQI